MIRIFGGLQNLVKIKQIKIDNFVMRLNYPVTVIILLAFCVIVTAEQFVGDPIQCLSNVEIKPQIINAFCWVQSTYTIPTTYHTSASYPGIDANQDNQQLKYHGYYQWVPLILCIQAFSFYLPHWLWKSWEAGKLETLSKPINFALYSGKLIERQTTLVDYLVYSRGNHNLYTIRFIFCELISLVNIVGQSYFLDLLFQGEFLQYGFKVVNFFFLNDDQRFDPMYRIFPKFTKCSFKRFGPAAGLDTVDALCLLPLNMIHEKIYVFLWFWLLFLSLFSTISIFYHLIVISTPFLWVIVTKCAFPWLSISKIKTIIEQSSFGDWFFLYMLGSNIDPVLLKKILNDLANRYESMKDVNSSLNL